MARGLIQYLSPVVVLLTGNLILIANANLFPEIESVSVINVNETNSNLSHDVLRNKQVEIEVRGKNFFDDMQIKCTLTAGRRNSICEDLEDYEISELYAADSEARFSLVLPPGVQNVFFCLPRYVSQSDSTYWYHQGINVSLSTVQEQHEQEETYRNSRHRRNFDQSSVRVTGIRVETSAKGVEQTDIGIPSVFRGAKTELRLFGIGFTDTMQVAFTDKPGKYRDFCEFPKTDAYTVTKESRVGDTIAVTIEIPENAAGDVFYICVKPQNTSEHFFHQGSEHWLSITTHGNLLPTWVAIIVIILCLSFSALFSGLNLGLMSMDMTELKILCNTGTPTEKKYAKKIRPIRKHGNYLLCSILLGNVLVNSIFTILLDGLTSGLIAVIFSTIAIVLFGEITPQAVCSRHGLAVGANTINITKVVMVLTAPLAYPVSKILDWILGEEIGNVYNRERLKELVKIQYKNNVTTGENDLDRDEVNIISGALELRRKTVAEVMTRIEDAFMLDYDAVLDFETVSEIMKSGYSRIPVYEGDRKKIITTLYIKDLAFVDPDDNTPLKTLCQFYQNPCNFVFEDVTLDVMFKEFKEGNKGHMAFVHRVNNEGEGDPFYETIGLITLEDVIEELIQAEIMDETDVVTDNRTRRKRTANRAKQDFTFFADRKGESNRIRISPQLTLATFQYLSASVGLFKPSNISETILRRLLKQDIIHHIKRNKDWRNDPSTIIYQQGKAADYFVLVLEGRVEVTVGQEHLIFESGPFTYFGTQALVQNVGIVAETPTTIGSLQSLNMDTLLRYTFQPDYTVRACTELLYLKVKRSLYLAAKKASLMEFSQKDTNAAAGEFDAEVEKLLHSLGEEDSLGRTTPDPKYAGAPPQYPQHNEPALVLTPPHQSPHVSIPKAQNNALSPTSDGRSRARSANGRLKFQAQNATPDDAHGHTHATVGSGKEEEVSLLPKKS
ncbi:hypothetical protein Trydic_g15956 [Trypoxylus dichotomus]